MGDQISHLAFRLSTVRVEMTARAGSHSAGSQPYASNHCFI
jgi:hypothetical protein